MKTKTMNHHEEDDCMKTKTMNHHELEKQVTPRTDAQEYQTWSEGNQGMGDDYAENVVPSELARDLEKELIAMTDAKNRALEALKTIQERAGDMRGRDGKYIDDGLQELIAELEVVK